MCKRTMTFDFLNRYYEQWKEGTNDAAVDLEENRLDDQTSYPGCSCLLFP